MKSVLGKGSMFTVSLPVDGKDATEASAQRPGRRVGSVAARGYSILVVDDEALVSEAIKANLEAHGHRMVTEADGVSALGVFREREFDIVFLDLGMPGMNGYQVAEEMKRVKPGVPVVLVTGWGDDVDLGRTKRLGIAQVIAKPFQPEELLQTVEQLLGDGGGHHRAE